MHQIYSIYEKLYQYIDFKSGGGYQYYLVKYTVVILTQWCKIWSSY